jgi:hypothetical protein
MEENSVLSGSILLAEFMGYKYIPFIPGTNQLKPGWWKEGVTLTAQKREGIFKKLGKENYLCRRHNNLRYYNSWDWLIPVIQKIQKLYRDNDRADVLICKLPYVYIHRIEGGFERKIDRQSLFYDVVKFVEWYFRHKERLNLK